MVSVLLVYSGVLFLVDALNDLRLIGLHTALQDH